MNLPPIAIILLTYKRTDYALRTIAAATRLRYAAPLLWYVADDGSPVEHVMAVRQALAAAQYPILGLHSEKRGYGGNANTAWEACDQATPLTFWLEDDWELTSDLDLTPYVRLLLERTEIGMVRLGTLNLDIRGRTWGHDGRMYWLLDREPHHEGTPVFTGHPSLRHVRYRYSHGWYPVNQSPGDTELQYAYQFRHSRHDTPGIVWPADLPWYGVFGHIGAVKSENL